MNIIKFKYLRINGKDVEIFELSTEKYFDLEADEEVQIDSVPKNLQPFQYVDCDVTELVFVKLNIEIGGKKRVFNQTFWNKGENFLTERIDSGKDNYRELILSVKIDSKNNTYETLRLFVSPELIIPTYHSLISSNSNGEEVEHKVDTTLFVDMIKTGKL